MKYGAGIRCMYCRVSLVHITQVRKIVLQTAKQSLKDVSTAELLHVQLMALIVSLVDWYVCIH